MSFATKVLILANPRFGPTGIFKTFGRSEIYRPEIGFSIFFGNPAEEKKITNVEPGVV